MKKLNAIITCYVAAILLVSVSCSKEPVTNTQHSWSSLNPPNPPIVVTPNSYAADSLTGKQFIFNKLSWTLDGVYHVCTINRPDLFYLPGRALDVSVSIGESQWINVLMCPYPTDPFFFESWPAGFLKVYVYNYTGPLLDSATSVKVLF